MTWRLAVALLFLSIILWNLGQSEAFCLFKCPQKTHNKYIHVYLGWWSFRVTSDSCFPQISVFSFSLTFLPQKSELSLKIRTVFSFFLVLRIILFFFSSIGTLVVDYFIGVDWVWLKITPTSFMYTRTFCCLHMSKAGLGGPNLDSLGALIFLFPALDAGMKLG